METAELVKEIEAYREIMQRGELTELDLDALCSCLKEAASVIEGLKSDAESGRMLRDDLIAEIVRYSRASGAMIDGVSAFDSGRLKERLLDEDTESLLGIRRRVRDGFMRLLRSNGMPRKTSVDGISPRRIREYRLESGVNCRDASFHLS